MNDMNKRIRHSVTSTATVLLTVATATALAALAALAFLASPAAPAAAAAAAETGGGGDGGGKVVWISRDTPAAGEEDTRSETERLFAPYGLMPAERTAQITVNASAPVDRADRSKGTCVEYYFEFKNRTDWMGSYTLVGGDSWGTKPGIDVQKLLGVDGETKIALRFRARGEGVVTFKIGGVADGPHKSSLRFPLQVNASPTRLEKEFREYTIGPIAAKDLTNLIDPFCVVTSGLDNVKRDAVRVQVDDVRLELFDRPRAAGERGDLPPGWREQLTRTLFVCYTPTGFDPTASPVKKPTKDEIRADLRAIRELADAAGLTGERAGVITYGCRDGLEQIAPLARETRLRLVLGIFNPADRDEVHNARELLGNDELKQTIVACCVGNEAITFRRASLDQINRVVADLQEVRRVPTTTTEILQSYGDKRLFAFDFTLVTAHPLLAGVHAPDRGARWTAEHLQDLLDAAPAGQPVLVKEAGWPAGPAPAFDEAQQETFWRALLAAPAARRANVCFFDGLRNVPWKDEPVAAPGESEQVNVGPHWPVLFADGRKPKPFAIDLLKLWKRSRGE